MKKEHILCVKADDVALREGVYEPSREELERVFGEHQNVWVIPRVKAEDDPKFKQLIPYIVFVHDGKIGAYTRGGSGSEARLHGKVSIGFGGHISVNDFVVNDANPDVVSVHDTLQQAALREVSEEVYAAEVGWCQTRAFINDNSTPVSSVHLGILQVWGLKEPILDAAESSQIECRLYSVDELTEMRDRMESWSVLAFDFLCAHGW
jgi:predicted NUDIX family phosphoesterase